MEALLDNWCAARPADVAADSWRDAGRDLLARWSEPHRHYHTLDHLAAMLSTVDDGAALADDPDAVRLATWFHDAIYEPQRPDNEDASANLAETVLAELGVHPQTVAEVSRLVRLTATHNPDPDDRNGALLCDADLKILAAPPDTYHRYAEAVRAEYAHIPDEFFRPGRAAVLKALMDRPTLFHFSEHQKKWEESARTNLQTEVSALTGRPFSRQPLDL